jgi:AcrR family transcriptional regulator
MTESKKKESRGERVRREILAAARAEILLCGTGRLTHQSIARRIGQSKASVLYHFPTKKALWEALIADYVVHLEKGAEAAAAHFVAAGLTPGEAVIPSMVLWYRSFCRGTEGWPKVGVALMGLHIHDRSLTEPIRRWYEALYRDIGQSGLPAREAGMVMMFFDGMFNAVKLGIDTLSPEKAEELQMFALELLFKDAPEKLAAVKKVIADDAKKAADAA